MKNSLLHRTLTPELLDSLPANHPDAIRSRRDLRLIHFLMGNERWMFQQVKQLAPKNRLVFLEMGAGDGSLSRQIAQRYPSAQIHAYDLQNAPPGLPANVTWHTGDIKNASIPETCKGDTFVFLASLFLHHFEDRDLSIFSPWLAACQAAIIVEPWRHPSATFLSRFINPLCNKVTQHDMRVSIEAGFSGDDLTSTLGIGTAWSKKITHHWRGSYRLVLHRHEIH